MVVVCQVKPDECSVCRAVNLPKFQTKESCVGSINLIKTLELRVNQGEQCLLDKPHPLSC